MRIPEYVVSTAEAVRDVMNLWLSSEVMLLESAKPSDSNELRQGVPYAIFYSMDKQNSHRIMHVDDSEYRQAIDSDVAHRLRWTRAG